MTTIILSLKKELCTYEQEIIVKLKELQSALQIKRILVL